MNSTQIDECELISVLASIQERITETAMIILDGFDFQASELN